MKNSLRLIAISVVFWFGLGVSTANAGVFNGQVMSYQYYFPDLNLSYSVTPTLSFNSASPHLGTQHINLVEKDLDFMVNSSQNPTGASPEPETHSMLLVGLGLVGLSISRRRIAS